MNYSLNGLGLISWVNADNKVSFVLRGNVLSDAVSLDGQTFTVTNDGEQVAIYAGYNIVSVSLEEGNTVVRCVRTMIDGSDEAIAELDENVRSLTSRVDNTESDIAELSKASNPEVVAFARIAVPNMSVTMTTTEVCSIVSLLPEWTVGASYEKNEAFVYNGKVYRAAQRIPEAQEIYKPGDGTESLYTLIEIAPDGIRIWKQPTEATNSFALGEKAHYPTASGPIYVSQRNGNTSVPGTDEWWVIE